MSENQFDAKRTEAEVDAWLRWLCGEGDDWDEGDPREPFEAGFLAAWDVMTRELREARGHIDALQKRGTELLERARAAEAMAAALERRNLLLRRALANAAKMAGFPEDHFERLAAALEAN